MLLIHVFQTGGGIILSRFRYPQCRCQQTSWLLRIPLHSETGAGSLKEMVKMGQTKHFLHMSASLCWYKKRFDNELMCEDVCPGFLKLGEVS